MNFGIFDTVLRMPLTSWNSLNVKPGHSAVTDYWVENGLPFVGVDLDDGHGAFSIRITAGSYTHEIKDVLRVSCYLSRNGDEDGLDVLDARSHVTLLRFENRSRE